MGSWYLLLVLRHIFVHIAIFGGTLAADSSLQGQLSTGGGYTDNVLSVADNDPAGKEGDYFYQVSPGLIFSQESKRFVHQAIFTLGLSRYVERSEANTFSSRLSYRGLYAVDPLSSLTLQVNGVNGRTNTFNTEVPDGGMEILPRGGTTYASGMIGQGFRRRESRFFRWSQDASARAFLPLGDVANLGSNYYFGLGGGAERLWKHHALGFRVTTQYNINGGGFDPSGAAFDAEKLVILGGEARWLWDLSLRWSFEGRAGGQFVVVAPEFNKGLVQPTGLAALRYAFERGRIEASYRHTIQPNLLVSLTTVNHTVQLRGGIPIPGTEAWSLFASAGYSRGQVLDLDMQALTVETEQVFANASLNYRPVREFAVSLRVYSNQQARSRVIVGIPEGYTRNQVWLTLTGTYPPRAAAEVPLRQQIRVDGSDEAEQGANSRDERVQ